MREEEANDDCWFMLPEEDDEETNWMDFKVGIAGPVRACSHMPRNDSSPAAHAALQEGVSRSALRNFVLAAGKL